MPEATSSLPSPFGETSAGSTPTPAMSWRSEIRTRVRASDESPAPSRATSRRTWSPGAKPAVEKTARSPAALMDPDATAVYDEGARPAPTESSQAVRCRSDASPWTATPAPTSAPGAGASMRATGRTVSISMVVTAREIRSAPVTELEGDWVRPVQQLRRPGDLVHAVDHRLAKDLYGVAVPERRPGGEDTAALHLGAEAGGALARRNERRRGRDPGEDRAVLHRERTGREARRATARVVRHRRELVVASRERCRDPCAPRAVNRDRRSHDALLLVRHLDDRDCRPRLGRSRAHLE